MKTKLNPNANANGTSLQGYVQNGISYANLVERLGEPHSDGKWLFDTPAGVATVIGPNYGEGPLEDVTDWYIGGTSDAVLRYVQRYIRNAKPRPQPKTVRRAVITLYIDPEAYEAEAEHPLTPAKLTNYGYQVNEDAASMYGYEGWKAEFQDVEVTR